MSRDWDSSAIDNDKRKVNIGYEELQRVLVSFFLEMFPDQTFTPATDLRPLGVDSVTVMELSGFLNVNYGFTSSPSDFYGVFTVEGISKKRLGTTSFL